MRLTRRRFPAAGLAGLMVLVCSGCHAIFPFDNEEPDAGVELGVADAAVDATADAALIDAMVVDAAVVEATVSDATVNDGLLSDQAPPDQVVPDQVVPDTTAPDACWPGPPPPGATACVDSEGAATNGCNACPPADDGDCDGLKGPIYPQDPWPWNRNLLLVADGFKGLLSARWTGSSGVTSNTTTGQVNLPKKSTLTLYKAKCVTALLDPNYLTEVRFSVSAKEAGARIFQLFTAYAAPVHRMCRISGSDTSTTLKVEVRTSTTATVSDSKTNPSFGVQVGTTMILQSWGEMNGTNHVHHCRLLTGDAKNKVLHVTKTQALSLPGTVMLSGDSATFLLDYVRIYKP